MSFTEGSCSASVTLWIRVFVVSGLVSNFCRDSFSQGDLASILITDSVCFGSSSQAFEMTDTLLLFYYNGLNNP